MSLSQSTVVLLHIFFRHGQVTPGRPPSYPKNPYSHLKFEPYGPGQLTNEGKRQSYRLGQYIRKHYKNFLSDNYYPGILRATSTVNDRTNASLQLFLAGLFPPKGELIWNPNLFWQPIPFVCEPKPTYTFFHASDFYKEFLPAYHQLHHDLHLSDVYKDVFQHIENYSGRKIDTSYDIFRIYGDLSQETEWGLQLPVWASSIYPEPVTSISALHFKITCGTPTLRNCTLRSPMEEIIENTLSSTRNISHVKLCLYACHAVNVAHFLIGFDSFTSHVPNYCSCLVLEVHRVDNKLYVQGLYKRNEKSHLEPIHMWGKNPCNIQDFVSSVRSNFK
ncbi:venom acid phosphatase Acph-1-like isoform X1 [Onthophagus taurus]|uniref:venom acid phosphatase Acph-1-like isoform X1 n=1 Tax=Onthophagus taurus TaxID=166361 RepID=UPI0039BE5F90